MKESLLQILPSLENILFECNFVSSSPQLNFSQIHSSCEHSIFPGKLSFNTHMFFQVTRSCSADNKDASLRVLLAAKTTGELQGRSLSSQTLSFARSQKKLRVQCCRRHRESLSGWLSGGGGGWGGWKKSGN